MLNLLTTEVHPWRAEDWAQALLTTSPLPRQRYERQLLARYQHGELTAEQVRGLLEASQYHILYRSHATHPTTEVQLQALLRKCRPYNAAHGITGLLLHSNGLFVQVLEGPEAAVCNLYARIKQDVRHSQVVTVSEGKGPARRFGHWDMGFGRVACAAVVRAFDTVLAQDLPPGTQPDDTLLQALLNAFDVEEGAA
ncbi:BLUF domain-containing protein [Hymenobacter arizonensis]|uniref:Sensors of blue-light using FAD n=1 Tax=Hymenobacter arizonensis TaxID=1227077 RepID=A0A1I5TYF1_HYMAR|nr:BLUF domain-containing protein [Hymenobacter arizonensis]SFP88039.1 Sensors of blue-light using FAD [Hymenobacter arizonensis]